MAFDPRNILVIDFGQLGDVVMSLPALRAIRERFPQSQITIAVGKPGNEEQAKTVKQIGKAKQVFSTLFEKLAATKTAQN